MKRHIASALLLGILVHPAFGAVDAFITFSGAGWNGPSKIELLNFKNAAVTSTEMSTGQLAQGHRKWAPFVITRQVDATSPKLRQFCASGKHIGTVVINAYQTGGHGETPYYTITLTNVLVSSYNTSSGGDRPTESISLNFTKITWNYVPNGKTMSDDWEART